MGFDLKDYVEVKDRVAEWYEKHPEGRIVSTVVELTETRVTVAAEVYRDSDPDSMPAGIGHSYMNIPGSTPYTKGSEIENAETSAWGRALAAAGVSTKHSIASRDEVQAKQQPKKSSPSKGKQGEAKSGSAGDNHAPQTGTKPDGNTAARPRTEPDTDTDGESPAQLVNPAACPHPEASRVQTPGRKWPYCGLCGAVPKEWR